MTLQYNGSYAYNTLTGEEYNFGSRHPAPPLKKDSFGREFHETLALNFRMQNWKTPFGKQNRFAWFYAGKGLRSVG